MSIVYPFCFFLSIAR